MADFDVEGQSPRSGDALENLFPRVDDVAEMFRSLRAGARVEPAPR
jgi:hypothetical protein